ncbi:MAG TPA: hypothetical protein ENN31_01660 [Candidatus Vogelbacteria bacterium]|nr:hypothetical protein [Candidatus Vogelbacteria bacterium]
MSNQRKKDEIDIEDLRKKVSQIFHQGMSNLEYEKPIKKIESIIKKYPQVIDEQRLLNLATLYDHQAFTEKTTKKRLEYENKAIKICQGVIKKNGDSVHTAYALWGIGRVWWHRKNRKAIIYAKQADRMMRKVTKGEEGMPLSVAVVYDILGNYRRAEYWYLKTIKETDDKFGVYFDLLSFYFEQKRYKKVYDILPITKKLYSKFPEEFKKTKTGKIWLKRLNEIESITKSSFFGGG